MRCRHGHPYTSQKIHSTTCTAFSIQHAWHRAALVDPQSNSVHASRLSVDTTCLAELLDPQHNSAHASRLSVDTACLAHTKPHCNTHRNFKYIAYMIHQTSSVASCGCVGGPEGQCGAYNSGGCGSSCASIYPDCACAQASARLARSSSNAAALSVSGSKDNTK